MNLYELECKVIGSGIGDSWHSLVWPVLHRLFPHWSLSRVQRYEGNTRQSAGLWRRGTIFFSLMNGGMPYPQLFACQILMWMNAYIKRCSPDLWWLLTILLIHWHTYGMAGRVDALGTTWMGHQKNLRSFFLLRVEWEEIEKTDFEPTIDQFT